jgi:hypothetical protein
MYTRSASWHENDFSICAHRSSAGRMPALTSRKMTTIPRAAATASATWRSSPQLAPRRTSSTARAGRRSPSRTTATCPASRRSVVGRGRATLLISFRVFYHAWSTSHTRSAPTSTGHGLLRRPAHHRHRRRQLQRDARAVRPGSARLHVKISYMGLFGWYTKSPTRYNLATPSHQQSPSHQLEIHRADPEYGSTLRPL